MTLSDLTLYASDAFATISPYLNRIIIALIIVLIGFIIGKLVEKLLRKLFSLLNVDERFARVFKARRNYARAMRRTVVRIIYTIAVLLALRYLSIMSEVLLVMLVLALLTFFISVILAGFDVVPNIAGRISLSSKRIVPGEEIILTDSSGTIHGVIADVTLTDVRIRRENGDVFIVPNALFLNGRLVRKKSSAR